MARVNDTCSFMVCFCCNYVSHLENEELAKTVRFRALFVCNVRKMQDCFGKTWEAQGISKFKLYKKSTTAVIYPHRDI